MALLATTSQELVALFDDRIQKKAEEIYRAIPGTLVKFLEKREIVKKVSFRQDFSASQVQMGTKKNVNFTDFEIELRRTIKRSFDIQKITEIRPEDLSQEITCQYKSDPHPLANPGQSVSTTLRFNKNFQKKEGDYWTNVNGYVYIYIVDECESNWFAEDKRKFSYELTIELNGVALNKDKAIKFSEKVSKESVPNAIEYLETTSGLTWDDI